MMEPDELAEKFEALLDGATSDELYQRQATKAGSTLAGIWMQERRDQLLKFIEDNGPSIQRALRTGGR